MNVFVDVKCLILELSWKMYNARKDPVYLIYTKTLSLIKWSDMHFTSVRILNSIGSLMFVFSISKLWEENFKVATF